MYVTFHLLLVIKATFDSPHTREETCVVIPLCLCVHFFPLWLERSSLR